MTNIKIEVEGLDEILHRMQRFPQTVQRETKITMEASLLRLRKNVPPYPPAPPQSKYVRTEKLGRSLGSRFGGGLTGGKPDIYEVKQGRGGYTEGEFGTNLWYAPYVIGDQTQAWMHHGRWWKIGDIGERAKRAIDELWQDLRDDLVAFLEGKMA